LKKERKFTGQNIQTDLVGTFNTPKCNFNATLGGLTNDSNKMIALEITIPKLYLYASNWFQQLKSYHIPK
jgi:hypothetical protein